MLVHKLDRFTRNVRQLLEVLESFEARRIRLISVSEQIDFSSPIGRVILTILAAFAQYYVDNLRQETAKGLREKAQRGLWVGPVPVGYVSIGQGRIVPSAAAETVRELYRLYLEGNSFLDVAAELNRRGLAGPNGGRWGRENVRVVLRNRAYMGFVSSGGVEYPGQHEPLISFEIWQAAAARRLESTRVPGEGGPRARGSLTGFLYCAHCGRKLWFTYGGKADTRSYYCPNSRRGRCTAPQFRADLVEAAAADLVELVAAGELGDVVEQLRVSNGEIRAVVPRGRYRRLLEKLGFQIAKNHPSGETEG